MYNLSEKAIAEKYEDLLFTKAMALYAAEESEKILSEIENEEPADPKNIEKIYSKTERRENFSTLWKVSKKLITFAAMVVFVAVVSLSSVVVASAEAREAVAEAIYHLVLRKTDRYTEVSIGNSTGFIDPEIYDWEGAYAPTYIPEGFVLLQKQRFGSQYCVDYKREGGYISFLQAGKDVIFQVDTEGADTVEKILIGESEGLLVSEDGNTYLNWSIGNTNFQIYGTCEIEEIIKMAQGIKPIEKYEIPDEEEYTFVNPEIYDWEWAFAPTYMPNGCHFEEFKDLINQKIVSYKLNDKYIVFQQAQGEGFAYVDTENADLTKTIFIGESEAFLVVKGESSSVYWNVDGVLLKVSGMAPTEEIIKIAEGIKPLGKTETEEPTEEYEFIDAEVFNWEGAFAPTYIPKNFEISDIDIAPDCPAVTYSKGEQFFVIYQLTEGAKARIDSENAEVYKTVFINGKEGLFIKKADEISITWNDGNVFFWLFGTIDEKEFLKVAEGIKPIGKTAIEEPAEEYVFVDPEHYNYKNAYAPTYMTEEFVQTDCSIGTDIKIHIYTFEDKFIYIEQNGITAGSHIDTENAQVVKEIVINGSQALYVEKDGLAYITWSFPDTLLFVCGNIDGEEIIKIAEGVRPIN